MRKNVLCVALVTMIILSIVAIVTSPLIREKNSSDTYDDGIKLIDLDTIYLESSTVEVNFSDVILSQQNETRKLIVSEQEATVSTKLTDRIIEAFDVNWLKKTQKVSYTGKGYFVVDLDNLTKDRIVEDKKEKTVTIKIDHAYLQGIEIDPNHIMIDAVQEGLLARGDIKLTVRDYNTIEKELRTRMEEQFNTVENGQQADDNALQMVKAVYEPIIKAIDSDYEVVVEFK